MRLFLIRHAKSSWDDPFEDDHARKLNARGRRSATAIGRWMTERGYVPDLVLCSDSARTCETASLLVAEWGTDPQVELLSTLYHADPGTLLTTLQSANAETVALIAHNPGIGTFACAMVEQVPAHARYGAYPTCATAVIDFDVESWKEIRPGTGRIVDFIVPRELTD